MKIHGEECELVESFDELRAGMIVWASPCQWCRSQERRMLARFLGIMHLNPGPLTKEGHYSTWLAIPSGCRTGNVTDQMVKQGRLYRVVDPLLNAIPVSRAKELSR